MLHRKLLEVLSRLPADERKSLRYFLESPYFTRGLRNAALVLRLYDYILKFKADEQHPQLSKQKVFAAFFSEQTFQEHEKGPLDTLASDLFSMVRRYLAQAAWEKAPKMEHESIALLQFYRKYELEERFIQTLQAFRKTQQNRPARDAWYYLAQFVAEEELSNFMTLANSFEDDGNMFAAHQSLDMFYSILKLEYICALEYQRISSNIHPPSPSPLDMAVVQWVEQREQQQEPLHQLYVLVIRLLTEPDDSAGLSRFEKLLLTSKHEIPADKYRDLQTYYRYFVGRKYFKRGDAASRQEVLQVFKEHFQQGYFHVNDKIIYTSLRVVVMFALKLDQFEWARKVLEETPPERISGTKFPLEAYSLLWSEYHFYKKEYDEAQQKLSYRPFENPGHGFAADILLIKIYFETENELLDPKMRALEQRVRRTKLSADTKERYFNFLKKLDKVIKYGWQKDHSRHQRLIEDIRTTSNIIQREWLLEKAGAQP